MDPFTVQLPFCVASKLTLYNNSKQPFSPSVCLVLSSTALMQIGGHLSQSREFRDVLEDLVTKVAEPLEEAGLGPSEIHSVFVCLLATVRAIPDNNRGSLAAGAPVASAGTSTFKSITSTSAHGDSSINASRMSTSLSFQRDYAYSFMSAGTASADLLRPPSLTPYLRKLTKTEQMRRDWLRFLTFSRMCTVQLIMSGQDS
jgi:hypothetical protein